jgi:dipeptidase E
MFPIMRLLLISNSTSHGSGYLDHCMSEILEFLGGTDRVGFVPFALFDRTGYTATAAARFGREGINLEEVTADAAGRELLEELPAIFVGGGNTFRLLKTLQDSGLLEVVRRRVGEGMLYMGASAGTNMAMPTIRTTNDMPIVEPDSFEALGLVSFQINAHYLDPDPGSTHMGETREQRLVEFLEESDLPVVGLREGAWIRVEGESMVLGGCNGARIFRRGVEPEERGVGEEVGELGA